MRTSFRERGLFDVAEMRRLVTDVIAGRRDGAYLILSLVLVEMWMRNFIDTAREPAGRLVGYIS